MILEGLCVFSTVAPPLYINPTGRCAHVSLLLFSIGVRGLGWEEKMDAA
jgi:hypothetical protein